jgi:hypothetical protein
MEKQTAVEWFNQQLVDRQNGKGDSRSLDEIFEQANKMFHNQIKDAVLYGLDEDGHTGDWKVSIAEDYYIKTYTK